MVAPRQEPTLGQLDELDLEVQQVLPDQAVQRDIEDLVAAVNETAQVQLEEAVQTYETLSQSASADPAAVDRQLKEVLKALKTSKAAAQALLKACEAGISQIEGTEANLTDRPEQGASFFAKAAEQLRQAKTHLIHVGYDMADWPSELAERVGQRVKSSTAKVIMGVVAQVEDRKQRVEQFFERVGQRIEAFADRVQAIPGAIADRMRQRGEAMKQAVVNVGLDILGWGVAQELRARQKLQDTREHIEHKIGQAAAVGEALVATASHLMGAVKKSYRFNLEEARARRQEQASSDHEGPQPPEPRRPQI